MLNEIYDFLISEVDNAYQAMNYFYDTRSNNNELNNNNYSKEINFSFYNLNRMHIFFSFIDRTNKNENIYEVNDKKFSKFLDDTKKNFNREN